MVTSCKKTDEILTTPQGVKYIYHLKTEGAKAEPDGVMEVHFKLYATDATSGKDTLVNDTYKTGQAMPAMVAGTPFKDLTTMVSVGDSLTVFVPADSLKGQTFAKAGTDVRYVVKFVSFTSKSAFEAKRKQEMQGQIDMVLAQRQKVSDSVRTTPLAAAEDKMIQKYIADKKLKAEKHASGMYVVYENKGEGDEMKSQDVVSVHYTGTLLDGTKFDSSLDRGEPIKMPIMAAQVIEGWDVGIPLFKKGGKGKLIIPSYMGYGDKATGEAIKANSILIFDIEVLGINEAPTK